MNPAQEEPVDNEIQRLRLKVEQYQKQLDDRWEGVVALVNQTIAENASLRRVERLERNEAHQEYLAALEAAEAVLQTGARYGHLLRPGQDVLRDGPAALAAHADALREERDAAILDRDLEINRLPKEVEQLWTENAKLRASLDAYALGTLAAPEIVAERNRLVATIARLKAALKEHACVEKPERGFTRARYPNHSCWHALREET